MLGRAVGAARAVGLDATGWELETGSKANGITWKLTTGFGRGSRVELGGWDTCFLGWTAAEAYDTLHRLAQAWEAVTAAQVRA